MVRFHFVQGGDMTFRGLLFSLAVALTGASAFAADNTDCVPQSEIQAIAQHFTQFQSLANKGEFCNDGSNEFGLVRGLMFMRKTQFAADMPNSPDDLFSGAFKTDWYQYFIGRINDFSIPSNCPKGVGAYVYMFGNTMYVCPMLLSANFTALDRASVMMHEARHIDGFPHMTCSRGARAGLQGACDTRIADHGSYGVTVETYAQLAAYAPNLHPALRAYSRASAVIYADEAFENPVRINRQAQFLVMTTQGDFFTLNMNGLKVEQLGKTPALGKISMRAQHMILYPDDKSLPAKYVFARNEGEIEQAAGDIATEYNGLPSAQRAEWIDVHIGAQWAARILRDKVRVGCDARSDSNSEISANGEIATALLYPNGYDRTTRSALVAMQSGKIHEVGCNGNSPYFRPSSVTFDQPYKRIQKAGSDVVGLTVDGRLFKINGNTSTPLQTPLDGRVHELTPNSHIDFLD